MRRCGSDAPPPSPAVYRPEYIPGSESFNLPASEVDRYERRLKFRNAHTETAWMDRDPTSIYDE